MKVCDGCGGPPRMENGRALPLLTCSRCRKAHYHDVVCQKAHYRRHQRVCRPPPPAVPYVVQPCPGKGQGLRAAKVLAKDETISVTAHGAYFFDCLVPPVLKSHQRSSCCAVCFAAIDRTQARPVGIEPEYPVYLCSPACQEITVTSFYDYLSVEVEALRALKTRHLLPPAIFPTTLLAFRLVWALATGRIKFADLHQMQAHAADPHHEEEKAHEAVVIQVVTALMMGTLMVWETGPPFRLGSRDPHPVAMQLETMLRSTSSSSSSGSSSIPALILDRIKVNAFTLSDTDRGALGLGLFHTSHWINHACHPNARQTFRYGSAGHFPTLEIRANRPIQVGEEVCISYIDESRPRHERQEELLRSYHFTCTCDRCIAEES